MKPEIVISLLVAFAAAPLTSAGGVAGRSNERFPQSAPTTRIEGRVVEVDSAGRLLVVRYQQRGSNVRRAFRITKDTAFPGSAVEGTPWTRLDNLNVGDRVRVDYVILRGRAVALVVERTSEAEDAGRRPAAATTTATPATPATPG